MGVCSKYFQSRLALDETLGVEIVFLQNGIFGEQLVSLHDYYLVAEKLDLALMLNTRQEACSVVM